jgi:hypothetical protein
MGVTEPEATFSPCFGAPFLVWHPTKYAELLAEKMRARRQAWLVNTGWSGGAYGTGKRMKLEVHARDHRRDPLRLAGRHLSQARQAVRRELPPLRGRRGPRGHRRRAEGEGRLRPPGMTDGPVGR